MLCWDDVRRHIPQHSKYVESFVALQLQCPEIAVIIAAVRKDHGSRIADHGSRITDRGSRIAAKSGICPTGI